jgi:hypothetical protein
MTGICEVLQHCHLYYYFFKLRSFKFLQFSFALQMCMLKSLIDILYEACTHLLLKHLV